MKNDTEEDSVANENLDVCNTGTMPEGDCTGPLCMAARHGRQEQGEVEAHRITIATYNADEVIANFERLLATLDFKAEMHEMGVGTLQWLLRAKVRREFTALSIAFWKLALEKSFPDQAEAFFAEYRSRSPLLTGSSRQAKQMNVCLDACLDILVPKKETDFSPVALHLATIFYPKKADTKRVQLRLSLNARSLYSLIFNNLV